RGVDPGVDEGHRLSLRLGPGDEAIRPRRRHYDLDALGQGLALFLRDRIRAARPALRSDRRLGGQGRFARRSDHSLLLYVRSGAWDLRPGLDAVAAGLRQLYAGNSAGAVSLLEAQGETESGAVGGARIGRSRAVAKKLIFHCSYEPIPDSNSILPGAGVELRLRDRPVLSLTVRADGIFHRVDWRGGGLLSGQISPPQQGRSPRADRRSPETRNRMDGDPVRDLDVHLRVGREALLPDVYPPHDGRAGDL